MHDAITIGDYCYRNKHEPMLYDHFDGQYLCGVILNPSVMKALILILCCLTLALVFTVIEKLRVLKSWNKIKSDDPQHLTDSLKEYCDKMD